MFCAELVLPPGLTLLQSCYSLFEKDDYRDLDNFSWSQISKS